MADGGDRRGERARSDPDRGGSGRGPSRQAERAEARRAQRRAEERRHRQDDRARRVQRSQRVTRRRRTRRLVLARVIVGVIALFAAVVWSGATEPTHQPRLADPVALHSYQVTYAVTFSGGVHNIERITVQRPGLGEDVTYRDGQIVAGELTNPDGLWDWSTNGPGGWVLLSQGAQRSVSDAQPVWAFNLGIDRKDVAVIGSGRVAGRPCTMVLTGEPTGQPLQAPDNSSQTRFCIDRTGVPLSQVWTLDGKLAEVMTATSFQPNFQVPPGMFDAEPRPPGTPPKPPVRAVPLSDKERSGLSPQLNPPPGFNLSNQYVSFQIDTATGQPSITTKLLYADQGTGELLELDYIGAPASTKGIPEPVAGGRQGYLSLDLYSSTLSVSVIEGASLVMSSPDPNLLLQAAARLRF